MIRNLVNFIAAEEPNVVDAPPGIYYHALELAAWLRDNDCTEPADEIEDAVAALQVELALEP